MWRGVGGEIGKIPHLYVADGVDGVELAALELHAPALPPVLPLRARLVERHLRLPSPSPSPSSAAHLLLAPLPERAVPASEEVVVVAAATSSSCLAAAVGEGAEARGARGGGGGGGGGGACRAPVIVAPPRQLLPSLSPRPHIPLQPPSPRPLTTTFRRRRAQLTEPPPPPPRRRGRQRRGSMEGRRRGDEGVGEDLDLEGEEKRWRYFYSGKVGG